LPRIVEDDDGGTDGIARDGLRDLKIIAVFADADAVVALGLAVDAIFIDDVGEVARLEAIAVLAAVVDHPARCQRPVPDGTRTCSA
jgi:hypothetical protein